MSSPPPLPVQPLAYNSLSAENLRPGLWTAVGIVSIILASLSILMSLSSVFSSFGFLMLSRTSTIVPTPIASPTHTGVTIAGVPMNRTALPDDMDAPTRLKVITILESAQRTTPLRRTHLDLLLTAAGHQVFPAINLQTPIRDIKSRITDSGTDGNSDWFITSTGRLELTDQRAFFRPSTTPGNIVEATAPSTVSSPTTVPVPTRTVVFPFQISRSASIVSITAAILNLAAAILLLIAGISVLRNSRKAIKRHWIFVFVKVPIVILAAVATSMLYSQMFSNVYNTSPGGPTTPIYPAKSAWIANASAHIGAAFSLAYPAALIFILNTRRIKDYVATL